MNRDFIEQYWDASIYEQSENQTHDVEFILKVLNEQLGNTSQKLLEIACGGGRIGVPLAQAGYEVTGIDVNEQMLMRCYRRMKGIPNIRCFRGDVTKVDLGSDYDIVVLASNVLINIEAEMDNKQAQILFINKAAQALKSGGHFYLSFNLLYNPAAVFNSSKESHYFDGGTDEMGTYGRTCSYGSVYDSVTQICSGVNHTELTTNNGEQIIIPRLWNKHIPTQSQVYEWLDDAGFVIERTYKNFTDEPFPEPIDESCYEITIWAYKQ